MYVGHVASPMLQSESAEFGSAAISRSWIRLRQRRLIEVQLAFAESCGFLMKKESERQEADDFEVAAGAWAPGTAHTETAAISCSRGTRR